MTSAEKQTIREAIDICVENDLFSEMEADKVMQLCYTAIGRAIREAEEDE